VTGIVDVAAVDDHPIVLDAVAGWVTAAESGIRVIGTAATVDALLAGPGRRAHVVLLDLDLGDGTTVDRNVSAILAAGPAVLVLAASEKPSAVRAAMRAGALGYVLKNEETAQIRAAIRAVAGGQDWISPRLAYIFATDDAADRPALSPQEARALQLYATGMPNEIRGPQDGDQRGDRQTVSGPGPGKICARRSGSADKIGAVLSSRRGRAPPSTPLTANPPLGVEGDRRYPSSALCAMRINSMAILCRVMTPLRGS
jgi:DNA-binding NarL/FixJ family response regulator